MVGYRNFENLATNIQWLAFLTGGEALHNNHHEQPTAAHFAMKRGEWDPAWLVIRLLEGVGLATIKRRPVAKAA
jgi:stearoyl-CoA desaturase (delta-9 desaturase)